MKNFSVILRLPLFYLIFILSSCLSDNENKDWQEEVFLTVSSEMVDFYPFINIGIPSEGIYIKEDKLNYWTSFPLTGIEGFNYEAGYEYRLKVRKTHLANPPEDGFNFEYELISIISKEKK